MIDWNILLTDQAEDDLRSIYEYLAYSLLMPETAANLILRLKAQIAKLNSLPQSYALYTEEPWIRRGLRCINAGNYAIFFVPVESKHTVAIIRIMYSGRNIKQILEEHTLSLE
ncbi:MAG: type II toxin-antitoxin system RelE/ParE family toxin [Firmicutes bacterium]|nr:type II toxin-antitoxin system RelE/ParE family toxin [Bacillota bacterium]